MFQLRDSVYGTKDNPAAARPLDEFVALIAKRFKHGGLERGEVPPAVRARLSLMVWIFLTVTVLSLTSLHSVSSHSLIHTYSIALNWRSCRYKKNTTTTPLSLKLGQH